MRLSFAAALLSLVVITPPVAAQFVGPGGAIPVVAHNPGLNGTFWRSDVSVLNINETPTSIVLILLPEIRGGIAQFEPVITDPMPIAGSSQLTLRDVMFSEFGMSDAKGALSVISTDGAPLVVSSRAYTFDSDGGSFGQDAHSILVASIAWASGLQHDAFFRTNVGIFMPLSPFGGSTVTFTVTAYNADGSVAGSGFLFFDQAGVQQKSLSAFGVGIMLDGYVEIACSDPTVTWYGYASKVDQTTGDAVYRAARGRVGDIP